MVPTQETISILKPACRTWEDHLWADISVIAEEKSSNELVKLSAGSFWEGGMQAVEKGPDELRNLPVDNDGEWEEGVLKALESLNSVAVSEGYVLDWRRFYHI